MSRNLDRALEALDAGLQSSPEASYGFDRLDRCWRCLKHPFEEGSESELCAGCRAHLLGDGPDPRIPTRLELVISDELREALERRLLEGDGTGRPEGLAAALERAYDVVVWPDGTVSERDALGFDPGPMISTADLEELVAFARRVFEGFAEAARRIAEALASIDWTPILEELERIAERARETSRRATRTRPTLTRGASRAPRDLRATEAPRRPPTTFRRKTP